MARCSLIALGGNISGRFGRLQDALATWLTYLGEADDIRIVRTSSIYDTKPIGCPGLQPRYVNAVLRVETSLPPAKLLKVLKRLERMAGRVDRGRNAARPLDLDIIDMGGRRVGWPHARRSAAGSSANSARLKRPGRRAWLTLPHPSAHRRRFVLEPLAEVCPHWHHPVLKVSVRQLLARLPRPPGQIRRMLDSPPHSCDMFLEEL